MSEKFEQFSAKWVEYMNEIKYTKKWQQELLGLLENDEMIDGYPSTEGLLRITRMLYGEPRILIDVCKSPTIDDRSASVKVEVAIQISETSWLEHHGSADVYPGNTKHPFNLHPVATAETKALGRALKRMLGLRIHTYEEMAGDDNVTYDKIQEQQIRAVENLAKKLNVNLDNYLAQECGITYDAFKSGGILSKEQGISLVEKLNEMRNKGVPDELKMVVTI